MPTLDFGILVYSEASSREAKKNKTQFRLSFEKEKLLKRKQKMPTLDFGILVYSEASFDVGRMKGIEPSSSEPQPDVLTVELHSPRL